MFSLPVALISGFFGLVIGSYINVVVLRAHTGRGPNKGRSECLFCTHQLSISDLIPVLSYVFLKGRCRYCNSAISIQYPLVECATALIFFLIGGWAGNDVIHSLLIFVLFLLYLAIAGILIAIAAYDIQHTIIPDLWAYTFGALALCSQFFVPFSFSLWTLLLAGPICALPLTVIWFLSRGRAMGLGDAKLALGIGWMLGPVHGLIAIFLAFVIGGAVGALLLLLSSQVLTSITPKRFRGIRHLGLTMKSEIAFGPFLISSFFIIWFILLFGFDLPLVW